MIRTTVVGSWPPDPAYADALQRYHRGEMDAPEAQSFLREVAATAIEQQRACGLDEYTGGETAADSFILHFPRRFSGIEPTENHGAWDGRGAYRLVGPLGAPQGLGIANAYQRERMVDAAVEKVTIPGPSEITMMIASHAEGAPNREEMLAAAVDLIRTEIQSCIALGATDIQLDLPHVAMGLVDEGAWDTARAVALVQQIFENIYTDEPPVRRSVHFCYGDFDAQTWTTNRNFHALLPTIQALDGVVDRVVLEFSLPEQWAERALLAEIPAGMEVAAGIVDVKSPEVEHPEALARRIEELLAYVPAERLLICPSCGFGRREVELARQKTTAMVQAVAAVNGRLDYA